MPKKDNVKENVSKQVKKDKQQKGSGPTTNGNAINQSNSVNEFSSFTITVEIASDNQKLLEEKIDDDDIRYYWRTEQELKNIKGEKKNNEYYIDTYLSKIILEVLNSHFNEYNINYLEYEYSSIKVAIVNKYDKPKVFIKDNVVDGVKAVEVNIDSYINKINIDDFNTFTINVNEEKKCDVKHDAGCLEYNDNIVIEFPTKLKFKLTKMNSALFTAVELEELRNLEERINEEINDKIKKLIDLLISNHQEIENELVEKQKEKDEIQRDEREKKRKEREKDVNDIAIYLYEILKDDNKKKVREMDDNPEEKNKWKSEWIHKFVGRYSDNSDNLDKMRKIVKKFKELEQIIERKKYEYYLSRQFEIDEMEREGLFKKEENIGGKKSKKLPKKEILGKMICIYKIPGDHKEYVRHKGKLITLKDYKELMKAKKAKKPTKLSKKK